MPPVASGPEGVGDLHTDPLVFGYHRTSDKLSDEHGLTDGTGKLADTDINSRVTVGYRLVGVYSGATNVRYVKPTCKYGQATQRCSGSRAFRLRRMPFVDKFQRYTALPKPWSDVVFSRKPRVPYKSLQQDLQAAERQIDGLSRRYEEELKYGRAAMVALGLLGFDVQAVVKRLSDPEDLDYLPFLASNIDFDLEEARRIGLSNKGIRQALIIIEGALKPEVKNAWRFRNAHVFSAVAEPKVRDQYR